MVRTDSHKPLHKVEILYPNYLVKFIQQGFNVVVNVTYKHFGDGFYSMEENPRVNSLIPFDNFLTSEEMYNAWDGKDLQEMFQMGIAFLEENMQMKAIFFDDTINFLDSLSEQPGYKEFFKFMGVEEMPEMARYRGSQAGEFIPGREEKRKPIVLYTVDFATGKFGKIVENEENSMFVQSLLNSETDERFASFTEEKRRDRFYKNQIKSLTLNDVLLELDKYSNDVNGNFVDHLKAKFIDLAFDKAK